MKRGALWFDGVVASGILPGATFAGAIKELAGLDLRKPLVEGRFDSDELVGAGLQAMESYDEIVIFPLSMGFLTAYDMIAAMRSGGDQRPVHMVTLEALTGVEDVKNPLIKVGKFVPPALGGLELPWLSRLIWKRPENQIVFDRPFLNNELDAHYEQTESFPFGEFLLQARYIAHHEPLCPEIFEDVRVVSIRSGDDRLLKVPESEEHLKELFGENLLRTLWVRDADHATLLENQFVWRERLYEGLEALKL